MSNEQSLNFNRVKRFNVRAKYHLKSDLGFNLKRPEDSFDLARSLLTEYADQFETTKDEDGNITFVRDADKERMAIAAESLRLDVRNPNESTALLETRLREMVAQGHVPKKEKHIQEFTLNVAGFAAKSLKKLFPEETKLDKQAGAKPSNSHRAEFVSATEPDYADIQDVIKYLYEIGNISPSHASALFVTLGYVRPETGMTEELNNDVLRMRADLRARIETYRKSKPDASDQTGIRIIEAFIARSLDNPNLQLSLDDTEAMTSVGRVLVKLHQLREVRITAPAERANKYDGMGTKIDIE